jgi:ferritin-like metal-binding protein YciE
MSEMFDRAKSRVLDRIESPRDLVEFKLGAALRMENIVLDMLDRLVDEARGTTLKELLAHHADETRSQVENIEQAFAALGSEADEKPCPTMEAIDKEGRANVKIADERMVDAVILSGAAETEHHEIAVYNGLITHAEALGEGEVVARLRANLEQEQHTLEEVERSMRTTARELAAQAV